ncbi:MAG: imidazole glycerol phosphate synthase subunit HisH [Desulfuromonadales bacterium]|nr:imidazole glycerol phosphate synthase subunit HisH [Desulfuromonadales bacterium]
MITIVDYEMGNLRSVTKAFESLGCAVRVSREPADLRGTDKIVLPGVGAFRDCIRNLHDGGFVEPLQEHVAAGRPLLGICVGMQMLFDASEEFGHHQGLGLIPGRVTRFPADMVDNGEKLKVPHMGWNSLHIRRASPLLAGIADGSYVYFVHSYFCQTDNEDDIAASCRYGDVDFCASVWRGNILATQFHPEKSQAIGLQIFENFSTL